MEFDTIRKRRVVVESYDKTQKRKSYLREMFFETVEHYQHFVAVNLLTSTIDTLSLGDGKISQKIADPDSELSDIYPGIVDVEDNVTSMEIADYEDDNEEAAIGFMKDKQQNFVSSLSQTADTLCAKSLDGQYVHESTSGAKKRFNFGTPVKLDFTGAKITATSTILELTAQTDIQASEMLDPATSKENLRILCSKNYYKTICKIVEANKNDSMIETIDEPGIKLNGYYYINDQAPYINVDKSKSYAVPENGSIMIDKSIKSKMMFCDMGLKLSKKLKSADSQIIRKAGLPYVIGFEEKKSGFLMNINYLAAPIGVPCLSKIVHGLNMCNTIA